MTFRIHALPPEPFAACFTMAEQELSKINACLVTADDNTGYPCRVSLSDAEVGERLVLLHFEHQPAPTPFRASHAIYIRQGVAQAHPDLDKIPAALASRLLSVRAFDERHFLRDADVVDGLDVATPLERMFDDERTAYVHLHYAKQGCYAARVTRC